MPGVDSTGPMGAGPMTGGRRGFCNPAAAGTMSNYVGYSYGRGLGLRRGFRGGNGPGTGMGRGYGRGYGWYPSAFGPVYPMDTSSEIDMLKEQADYMKNSLDAINRRIEELDRKPSESS